MGSPARPNFVKQLDGSRNGPGNCNTASAAMALDRQTLGAKRTTGARVRELTGDTTGGTTLPQVAAALNRGWSEQLSVKSPTSISDFDARLEAGQGAILQGAASATRGTRWQGSETFGGNHSWFVNELRDDEYLVYDPLADGRRSGIAQSPFWLPRSYLLTFAKRLDLNGNGSLLGPGKAYAAFTRDTEPHAHYRFSGTKTSPFPDRTRGKAAKGKRVNVRKGPSTAYAIVDYLMPGDLFIAFQRTTSGLAVAGSRTWYGDHQGDRWVHESGLLHEGGTT